MKRLLQGLAVVWAIGLVGWAIASAQGWLDDEEPVGEVPPDPPNPALDALRREEPILDENGLFIPPKDAPLMPGTKADVADGIGGLRHVDDEALLPATKSLGGIIGTKGTQMGTGGLGARGSGLSPGELGPGGIGAQGKLDAKAREQGSE